MHNVFNNLTDKFSEFSPLFVAIGVNEKTVTKHRDVNSVRKDERRKSFHGITIIEKFM